MLRSPKCAKNEVVAPKEEEEEEEEEDVQKATYYVHSRRMYIATTFYDVLHIMH
jgi:hypothetical protein